MRSRVVVPAVSVLLFTLLAACGGRAQDQRPRLVVLVAVDQLRADMLDTYDSLFTGGLRRLRDTGYRFTNAVQDHAITHTAAGHAALATGVYPSRNGIVVNSWAERRGDGWRGVYAVEDSLSRIIGLPAAAGRSPANLLREGLPDWMVAADSATQVVSVSRKDRSAITLAGKTRGHVYWLAPAEGRFVTSAYYADNYPGWVERFNRDVMPTFYQDSVWTSTVPESARATTPDTAAWEGDGVHTYFPHRFSDESAGTTAVDKNLWISGTPFVDAATLAFARTAVQELGLGQDRSPDYLAVALSQTDIVGHGFGPESREQLDNLLRLDRELDDFLSFLDETVGEGRWVLGLSADHGVLSTPEYLAARGESARRVYRDDLLPVIEQARAAVEGGSTSGNGEDAQLRAARILETSPLIEDAIPYSEIAAGPPADSFVTLYRKSYHEGRVTAPLLQYGILSEIRLPYGMLLSSSATGTSHGSPYWYDRHVPFVLTGAGIEPGASEAPARTIDMAPTLAALLGIRIPADLDGLSMLPGSQR